MKKFFLFIAIILCAFLFLNCASSMPKTRGQVGQVWYDNTDGYIHTVAEAYSLYMDIAKKKAMIQAMVQILNYGEMEFFLGKTVTFLPGKSTIFGTEVVFFSYDYKKERGTIHIRVPFDLNFIKCIPFDDLNFIK